MHKQNRVRAGFTIVELLIVIVVIAILAAISTVADRGLQERARASEVSSALSQAKKKLELYKVDNGTYPTSGNLASAGVTSSDGAFQYTSDGSAFCLTATSGTVSYTATNTTSPSQGGCAGHGQGGVAAITNLAVNPRAVNNAFISTNDGNRWTVARNVSVPATPDGITSAAESRLATGATEPDVMSVYNIDGLLNNSGISRSISIWVRVNTTGYSVGTTGGFPQTSLPANAWVRVQTTAPVAGNAWSGVRIRKDSGNAAESDRAYITGIFAVEGSQHYSFADGNSPKWIWNGTPNNSSSTGPAL